MIQHFLLLRNQPLLRLPQSVIDQLAEHKAAISECADQKVRVAQISTNDDKNGVPQEIHRVDGWYLEFDKNGMLPKDIKQQWINDAFARVEGHEFFKGQGARDEKVVDLESRAKSKERDARTRWEPTPEERTMLIAAALGHPRAIKNIRSQKFKQPPGPEVSWKTREAFGKLKDSIWGQYTATSLLDESELMGLSQLIDEHLKDDPEQEHGWRGAQADIAGLIKIKEAHRTGSGSWYALVDVMRWKGHTGEQVKSAAELHPNRDAAAESAQRLLRDHIQYMKGDTSVEARVVSELEWEE